MTRRGRPPHAGVLTPRQWEVLELLRQGLANEEIAERLGITLDGAKYHVSEIMGKLSVGNRAEAAAWEPEERRPWWAAAIAWGVAARLVGAGIIAASLAGLGILLWGVLRTDSEPSPDVTGLAVQDVFARAAETLSLPRSLLHTTITLPATRADDGQEVIPTTELWIDGESDTVRIQSRGVSEGELSEGTSLVVGRYVYTPDDPGEALRDDFKGRCPGNDSAAIAILFLCDENGNFWPGAADPPRVDAKAEYEGRRVVSLTVNFTEEYDVSDAPAPPPPATPAPPLRHVRVEGHFALYVDPETFLPVARVISQTSGDATGEFVARYQHEFLDRDDLPEDFLDPRSIGYGAENADALLNEIARDVPVYWFDHELELPGDLCSSPFQECSLVLTRIMVGGEAGEEGILYYETPRGVGAFYILLWWPADWEKFMLSDSGRVLQDPRCAEQRQATIGDRQVALYIFPQLPVPAPSPLSQYPCAARLRGDLLTSAKVIAFANFGNVVVDVRADITGYHGSPEAMEAVLQHLRRR